MASGRAQTGLTAGVLGGTLPVVCCKLPPHGNVLCGSGVLINLVVGM